MSIQIVHPSTILISGPTGSGKTRFVQRLINEKLFSVRHDRIIWVYSEWQKIYDQLVATNLSIEFIQDFDEDVYKSLSSNRKNLVILDDQMSRAGDSRTLSKLFTEGSHHRGLSIIYIVQNLFDKGKSHRTVSLNSQYLVLFKNPRDMNQIEVLGRQMFPNDTKFLVSAFEDATLKPYGYLFLDLRPETDQALRVNTNIFPGEPHIVYMSKKGIKGENR